MKKLAIFLLSFVFLCVSTKSLFALEDPRTVANNKFGIHIMDESDLNDAANLVNSSGGDWGYVTIVIQSNDRVNEKWQNTFNKMRDLHLIPIVRIASEPTPQNWQKLKEEDIQNWVDFLNSLSWPTKNRYVIIGNEPNHAKEWGGDIDPGEYSNYLRSISTALKDKSPDFFILPAGLDASAPNGDKYMDEELFIKHMVKENPDILNYIDGWTSHSYPNPAFSGDEKDTGRGSIRTYEWEISLLKSLGLTKDLPIFITETGWVHSMNGQVPVLTSTQKVGEKLTYAFNNIWNDRNVVSVTPFILNYQSFPFETFSWKAKDGSFYSFYDDVKNLAKVSGTPKLNPKKIKTLPMPKTLPRFEMAYYLLGIDPASEMKSMPNFGRI